MIFVTVGTHEQQFDRLVKCVDELKRDREIQEDVIVQTGYSNFEPKYCTWSRFFSYSAMTQYIQEARIIVTHGGPSSFIPVLQIGKIPVVIPRQKKFREHVNNHQLDFCRMLAQRYGNLIVVEDIDNLKTILSHYQNISDLKKMQNSSNNAQFNIDFKKIIKELFYKQKEIYV